MHAGLWAFGTAWTCLIKVLCMLQELALLLLAEPLRKVR